MMRLRKALAVSAAVLAGAGLYATLAVAGVAAASASPDLAGNPTCLASGSTCIRDANNLNTSGNPVVEGSNINGPAENTVYNAQGELQFTSHLTLCVGLNSADTKAITQLCQGGHGVLWTELSRGCCGAVAFVSNVATQHFGTEEDLTAVNSTGFQLGVAAAGQGFQRWK